MPNKRISELNEKTVLLSDSPFNEFPSYAKLPEPGSLSENIYFMLAREKVSNEKISHNKLKSSFLDSAIFLTGNQLVSGHKTFSDPCVFLSRSSINEIIDITETGDISGNIFVGESGLFSNLGVGSPFFNKHKDQDYILHISGDSCFFGDVAITGDMKVKGDSVTIGNAFLSGNLRQTGNYHALGNEDRIGGTKLFGDFHQTGKFFHLGDYSQTGDTIIYGDQFVTGDIYLGEYLYHLDDKDTHLRFTDDTLELVAGSGAKIAINESTTDTIKFFTSGIEQAQINNEGFLSINNNTPLGELAISGKSFNENIFIWDELSNSWSKVFGGDDETVSFKTPLSKGILTKKIDFPKTFIHKPILSVVLQHENGGPIIPLNVSNATTYDFEVHFGSELKDEGYFIHTTALAPSILTGVSGIYYENPPHVTCSDPTQDRLDTQRFFTKITEPSDEVEINFPFGYKDPPVVTITLEGTNKMIPYTISSVNKDSYTIIFGSSINEDFTIHTFSSREGIKRLG